MSPDEQLKQVLSLLNDNKATKDELFEISKLFVDIVKQIKDSTEDYLENARKENDDLFEESKRKYKSEMESMCEKIERALSARIASIKDGKTPVKGVDYFDGVSPDIEEVVLRVLDEIPEPQNLDGLDIRNYLEALPEDDKLEIEAIRGLRKELDELRKMKSGSSSGGSIFGGISHTPTHETFTMNGSDTTVTLSQGVAAGGNAIIALRYQGQVLDMTTHYTVNGNKITFVGFTPENGTIISVTYIP